jgi:2-polyprenyl-3-methyl-5-hydroxy-6-metoxy-1,4-benzoquinol methylase
MIRLTHQVGAAVEPQARFIEARCDLCGSDRQELLFEKEGFRHVRCRNCGLVFVNPRLSGHVDAQTSGGTGTMGDDYLTPAQVRRLEREVAFLEPFRRLNRILEVGAGWGWFLSKAARLGWETWAVEINRSALERLARTEVHKVLVEPAETVSAPHDHFDVVRIWDVIEHLESPAACTRNMYRVLRPGGLLRLSTTNFASLSRWVNGPEWVYLNGADHIVLFEPATMTRLLAEAGFSAIEIRTRSFNLRRKLYHPERILPPRVPLPAPLRKLIDEMIGLTRFGHQMIVTAVKPGS